MHNTHPTPASDHEEGSGADFFEFDAIPKSTDEERKPARVQANTRGRVNYILTNEDGNGDKPMKRHIDSHNIPDAEPADGQELPLGKDEMRKILLNSSVVQDMMSLREILGNQPEDIRIIALQDLNTAIGGIYVPMLNRLSRSVPKAIDTQELPRKRNVLIKNLRNLQGEQILRNGISRRSDMKKVREMLKQADKSLARIIPMVKVLSQKDWLERVHERIHTALRSHAESV